MCVCVCVGGGGGGGGEVMSWCGTMGVYGDGEVVCRNSGWGGGRWL